MLNAKAKIRRLGREGNRCIADTENTGTECSKTMAFVALKHSPVRPGMAMFREEWQRNIATAQDIRSVTADEDVSETRENGRKGSELQK